MKVKIYQLLDQCIENGTKRGYYRAHKHIENPVPETIIQSIEDSVMAAILEYFSFDDEE